MFQPRILTPNINPLTGVTEFNTTRYYEYNVPFYGTIFTLKIIQDFYWFTVKTFTKIKYLIILEENNLFYWHWGVKVGRKHGSEYSTKYSTNFKNVSQTPRMFLIICTLPLTSGFYECLRAYSWCNVTIENIIIVFTVRRWRIICCNNRRYSGITMQFRNILASVTNASKHLEVNFRLAPGGKR